jgi:signal transduction histidine kinase
MNGSVSKPLNGLGAEPGTDPTAPIVVDDTAQLIIDPFAGVLEAANLKGRQLLRLAPAARLPLALDSAMPGLRHLRAISGGAEPLAREHLVFWCYGKSVRVSAEVLKETMRDGRSRMVVRALNGPARAVDPVIDEDGAPPPQEPVKAKTAGPAPVIIQAADKAAQPEPAAAPAVQRDDRDTLREIGRRIRAGHARAAPDPHGPSAAAAPQDNSSAADEGSPETDEAAAPPQPEAPAPEPFAEGQPLPSRQPAAAQPDARTLSKVAHELKTPLSAIVAAAEIMRDEQLGPMGNKRYLGYAGDIHESARHALDVINAMLSGTPKEVRTIASIDLNSVVASTVSALTPLATSSGVGLEADTVDDMLEVRGDATGIRQIIYNLVSNALKFTPQDGYVHVATGLLPDGSPYFVVRDTGEGMSEDEIVQAFYAEATGPRRGGGYGIGLPMVRRLAEVMGATIDVDSTPGKGTVVLVSFPIDR